MDQNPLTDDQLASLFQPGQDEALAEADTAQEFNPLASLIRCKCGALCNIALPMRCACCGELKCYWKADGKILKLSQMTLGHLNNSVRALAAKAEEYPAGQRERFEIALDMLYAEIGSRGQEIAQVTGIMAALTRSLEKKA